MPTFSVKLYGMVPVQTTTEVEAEDADAARNAAFLKVSEPGVKINATTTGGIVWNGSEISEPARTLRVVGKG